MREKQTCPCENEQMSKMGGKAKVRDLVKSDVLCVLNRFKGEDARGGCTHGLLCLDPHSLQTQQLEHHSQRALGDESPQQLPSSVLRQDSQLHELPRNLKKT